MTNIDYIVTVANWEERFQLGIKKLLEDRKPKGLLVNYCQEYANISEKNRTKTKRYCKKHNIKFFDNPLSFKEPVDSWNSIKFFLESHVLEGKNVIVDISTMPRETIWTTLLFLENLKCKVFYTYHQPKDYSGDWLTKEPGKPRIVFKLGGISKLGASTKLLILSGYDIDRINQLINFFEPELTLLGIQLGSQLKNEENNRNKCHEEFENKQHIELFNINSYSQDHGYDVMDKLIEKHIEKHNIILTSLGPRLSAIALYRLHKKYPGTALAYVPSHKFNQKYSSGLGKLFKGQLAT